MKRTIALIAGILVTLSLTSSAGDAVKFGELIQERPTLICLGVEWRYEGDDNRNASVAVAYRKAGEQNWHKSLPLYRVGGQANYGFNNSWGWPKEDRKGHKHPTYQIPDAFLGSVLDLDEDTAYEVRLTVTDPDGVEGEAEHIVKMKTRAEPRVPENPTEVRHVYPRKFKGKKEYPVYQSVMHAVNGHHPWCDCFQTVHPGKAPPGTVIKVHAGEYKDDYSSYREAVSWLHGTQVLVADGTAEKPIYIVAAGDGEVVFDANNCDNLFNIMAADYLYFEGFTIRNTRIAFHAGFQGVMGCKGLTVKHCRMENIQYGVLAQDGRSEDFYIADNTFIGRNPGDRFNPDSGGAYGRTKGGYSVNLSGQGHVVCYNYAANFWDVMNVFTNALADPALGQQARAIDFYNNDLFNGSDNMIESDGSYGNVRIMRNRAFNCMAKAFSIQPNYAGPVYWIRNVVYNVSKGDTPIKGLGGKNPIVLHNTFAAHLHYGGGKTFDVRNNLFLGPNRDRNKGPVTKFSAVAPGYHLDHNGHRVGGELTKPFAFGKERFDTIEELAAASGVETHGISIVDYSIFVNAKEPEHHASSNKTPLLHPKDYDLRLKPGSKPVDAGAVIPGVNDGFTGKAPDLGAYEVGKPLPHYGPRERVEQ